MELRSLAICAAIAMATIPPTSGQPVGSATQLAERSVALVYGGGAFGMMEPA